jgi:uncharacterized damage-inducible protein DinB
MADQGKAGRGRRYDIQPADGVVNGDAALALAMLDELVERLVDLIADLSPAELSAVPDGCANSIQMLVSHMAWGEAGWVSRATGATVPPDLAERLPSQPFEAQPLDAEELIALCRDVRERFTRPALAEVDDIDATFTDTHETNTTRRGLMHLVWHWTYHSGQVGLLRRIVGRRYQWRFA